MFETEKETRKLLSIERYWWKAEKFDISFFINIGRYLTVSSFDSYPHIQQCREKKWNTLSLKYWRVSTLFIVKTTYTWVLIFGIVIFLRKNILNQNKRNLFQSSFQTEALGQKISQYLKNFFEQQALSNKSSIISDSAASPDPM